MIGEVKVRLLVVMQLLVMCAIVLRCVARLCCDCAVLMLCCSYCAVQGPWALSEAPWRSELL